MLFKLRAGQLFRLELTKPLHLPPLLFEGIVIILWHSMDSSSSLITRATMTPPGNEKASIDCPQRTETAEEACPPTPQDACPKIKEEEQSPTQNTEETQHPGVVVPPPSTSLPSFPSSASFSSPPLNPPYASYYGPSYSAIRNFNRANHAMMATIKTFPEKLHQILDVAAHSGMADVISFFPHGRSFKVHKPNRFVTEIMPRFFKQTKLTSFQRQLNLYGFKRISKGMENGGYYHPLFIQGQPHLADQIKRQVQTKGGKKNTTVEKDAKSTPASQPNFYAPSYNSYPPNASATPSYYPSTSMVPPGASYATPYGFPPMYASGWPVAPPYGMHPAYTPMGYGAPPPGAQPTPSPEGSNDVQDSIGENNSGMPQVSPLVSSPTPSFTPIKLSAVDNMIWTPGALCLD